MILENVASNFNRVGFSNGGSIWFSYQTPVAAQVGSDFCISENIWSKTTGKHLNLVHPDKSKRVPNLEFQAFLQKHFGNI